MSEDITIARAMKQLTKAVGNRFKIDRLFKTALWITWLILAVAFLSAVFGSIEEYEPQAALGYGIILLILLAVAAVAGLNGRTSSAPGK